jgi:hypothetical protein
MRAIDSLRLRAFSGLAIGFALSLAASPAFGQTDVTTSRISGTVKDADGDLSGERAARLFLDPS